MLLFIAIEKVQKKAPFSYCGQRKAFLYEIVFRGIQPYFLHGGALGLSVLKCNQGSDILENFEVIFSFMVKEITFLNGNLCIYKCFIDVLFILASVFKEKLQNVPRLEMESFCVEFCSVLSRFLLA